MTETPRLTSSHHGADVRRDRLAGAPVHIVGRRQERPNRPSAGCPFCVGGLEAPDNYRVRWFPNRWPAMPGGRCEVVLYTPDHGATLASLGVAGARRVVDLWSERTAALGRRRDVGYVLVFENRGAGVGATIEHPHGQIYAFADVPPVPAGEAARAVSGDPIAPGPHHLDLAVGRDGSWQAWVPWAPAYPIEVLVAPDDPVPDLPALDDEGRTGLARLLVDVLGRFDALYSQPLPYMLWIHQCPPHERAWPVRLHLHLVSPLRAAGTWRYVAAGELGSGVYFNPVDPLDAARMLRATHSPTSRGDADDAGH